MFACKFGGIPSVQFSPILTYRNMASVYGSNLAFSISIRRHIKVSKQNYVLFEYAGRHPSKHLDPFSIGYEITTVGHVFQIVFSTTECDSAKRRFNDYPKLDRAKGAE